MTHVSKKGTHTPKSATIGEVTFFTRFGKTYARVAKNEVTRVPRTLEQQKSRISLAQLLQLWKSLPKEIRQSLPLEPAPGQSNYNAFMHHNMSRNNVYLPHDLVSKEGCAMPFNGLKLSEGVLAPVELTHLHLDAPHPVTHSTEFFGTDIALRDFTITDATTQGDLTRAILATPGNGLLRHDTLKFFWVILSYDRVPHPSYRLTSLALDPGSKAPLTALHPYNMLPIVHDGFLALPALESLSLAVWVERKVQAGTTHSPSALLLNAAYRNAYTSAADFDAAIASYGGLDNPAYLTPDQEGGAA